MSDCIKIEKLCQCIVHLESNKRAVLPQIYLIENYSDFTKKKINNWYEQLSKEDKDKYVTILKDNVLGNFLTVYPHNNDSNQLDEMMMITRGGVRSLIKYICLKRQKDRDRTNELLQLVNDAFALAEQSIMKHNVFDDRNYEDQQYKGDAVMNIEVHNSPGAMINAVNGNNNDVDANQNEAENLKPTNALKIKMVVSLTFFLLFLVVILCIVYADYQKTQDFGLTMENMSWLEWILALLDLGSGILGIRFAICV